jgi:hypothetical protein
MNTITTQINELKPKLDGLIPSYVVDLNKPYVDNISLLKSFYEEVINMIIRECDEVPYVEDSVFYKEKPKKVINKDKRSGFIVTRDGISTTYKKGYNGTKDFMSEVFRSFLFDEEKLFGTNIKEGREFFYKHMGLIKNKEERGRYRLNNTFSEESQSEVKELETIGGFFTTSMNTNRKLQFVASMCDDKGYRLEMIYSE